MNDAGYYSICLGLLVTMVGVLAFAVGLILIRGRRAETLRSRGDTLAGKANHRVVVEIGEDSRSGLIGDIRALVERRQEGSIKRTPVGLESPPEKDEEGPDPADNYLIPAVPPPPVSPPPKPPPAGAPLEDLLE